MTAGQPAPTGPVTARSVLFRPDADVEVSLGHALVSDDAAAPLRQALGAFNPTTRVAAGHEVARAASGLLDVDVVALLVAAWRKDADLHAAAQRTAVAPGSSELVELATTRFTTEQRPYVDLLIDGKPVARVDLDLAVVFDVQALAATVRGGAIVALHSGRCDVTATLSVEDVAIAHGQTTLDLPLQVPLKQGIPLVD